MASKIYTIVNNDGSFDKLEVPMISLSAVRENANMSQPELAKRLDVTKETILNWEKGHTKIKSPWLMMFAKECNFPVDLIDVRN